MTDLYDVVAVTIEAPHTKRLIAERETKKNAEAIVKLAVMRRGVDEEFFSVKPHPASLEPTP